MAGALQHIGNGLLCTVMMNIDPGAGRHREDTSPQAGLDSGLSRDRREAFGAGCLRGRSVEAAGANDMNVAYAGHAQDAGRNGTYTRPGFLDRVGDVVEAAAEG
jgi:hypothetical protein